MVPIEEEKETTTNYPIDTQGTSVDCYKEDLAHLSY